MTGRATLTSCPSKRLFLLYPNIGRPKFIHADCDYKTTKLKISAIAPNLRRNSWPWFEQPYHRLSKPNDSSSANHRRTLNTLPFESIDQEYFTENAIHCTIPNCWHVNTPNAWTDTKPLNFGLHFLFCFYSAFYSKLVLVFLGFGCVLVSCESDLFPLLCAFLHHIVIVTDLSVFSTDHRISRTWHQNLRARRLPNLNIAHLYHIP